MLKKIILLVLDGAADRPVVNGKTPLQAARTPNLDRLASLSSCGRVIPRNDLLGASTDATHFAFLGYSIDEYPGRSVLEAAALGIPLRKDAIYLSCLLARVEENGLITREKLEIDEASARDAFQLVSPYRKGFYTARIYHQSGRYGVLELSGPVDKRITDTDPFKDGLPLLKSKSFGSYRAESTAAFLNDFTLHCMETLSNRKLPGGINAIICKWTSKAKAGLPDFKQRTSLKGAIVAQPTFFKGMAKILNMHFTPLPQLELEEEIEFLIKSAEQLLLSDNFEFVLLHCKHPDKASHRKNPGLKIEVLERIDRGVQHLLHSPLFRRDDVVIGITSDHPTPSTGTLIHTGEFTPLCIKSPLLPVDEVSKFNEVECSKGYLGSIQAENLMALLLNSSDRVAFSGSRYSPFRSLGFMKRE